MLFRSMDNWFPKVWKLPRHCRRNDTDANKGGWRVCVIQHGASPSNCELAHESTYLMVRQLACAKSSGCALGRKIGRRTQNRLTTHQVAYILDPRPCIQPMLPVVEFRVGSSLMRHACVPNIVEGRMTTC
mgnify:FL=1